MPLQYMATASATQRIHKYAQTRRPGSAELLGTPVGQIVGMMNEVRSVKQVVQELVTGYIEAVERVSHALKDAAE